MPIIVMRQRVNQGTRYYSTASTAAAVDLGIMLNQYNGYGNPNHYVYGLLVFSSPLSAADENVVETNI